ncbi:MAG: PKD domain-containing protein [Rhodothermaceae bacterium]|nr:PKD domain-containing protein [Rhodothermaceae bacterium]
MKTSVLRNRIFAVSLVIFWIFGSLLLSSGSEKETEKENYAWHGYERVGFPDVKAELGEAKGDNARARVDYELKRLRDPVTGEVPKGIRARELAKAKTLPTKELIASKSGASNIATWTGRGPNNVGGRTRALAIDLDFDGASNRRILAGGVSGGMYLSEDNGATWRLTTGLEDLASVTAVAQDPLNRNVWYYGTGELFGNSSSNGGGASFLGQGIFKSTNSGESWTQLAATTNGTLNVFDNVFDRVWNVAVDPTNGNVFAAVFGFIMRSTDGGDSWLVSLGPDEQPFGIATDVAIASNGTIYASISRNGNGSLQFGIFQSTDGGVNWTNISPPELSADPWRQVIGVSPSDPNTVYVLVQANGGGENAGDHQLFRYNASSNSWTNLSANIPNVTANDQFGNAPLDGNASFSSQGGYDMVVKVKPDDPDVIWIGGTNLYRSTDGGSSFEQVGGYASPYTFAGFPRHHPDQHALVFYPNDASAMISGHDGGLSLAANVLQSPQSWTELNNGYLTSQFYALAIDPETGSDFIVGGLQDNGTWSTTSANGDVDWQSEFSGDGGFAAVAPGGLPYYVSSQLGFVLRASESSGRIVGSVVQPAGGNDFLFITPYLLDPNDARVMYIAEGNRVWRNSNLDGIPAGNGNATQVNWTALTGSVNPNTSTVTALGVSKVPADRLVFGATDLQFATRIIRVDDPANNGPGTDITPPGITQGSYPSSIAINPDDADEIVATFSNYNVPSIWHTSDGGSNWTNIEGNLSGDDGPSVAWGLVMPTASITAYFMATSTGVYSTESLNGASTEWVQEGADVLGNVDTDMLVGRPEDGLVVAATHGRGVYSAAIQGTSGSGSLAAITEQVNLEAQPGETATGTLVIQNTGEVRLRFDINSSEPGKRSPSTKGGNELKRPIKVLNQPVQKRRATASGLSDQPKASSAGEAPVGQPVFSVQAGDDVLIYDDGDETADDFWGFGDAGLGLFWGNEFVVPEADFTLDGFDFFMRTEEALSNNVELTVYDENDDVLLAGTIDFATAPFGDWFFVTVNEPVLIPAGEPFFIEIGASSEIEFPAGIDSDAQVTGNSLYRNESSDYRNLTEDVDSGFEEGAFLVRANGTLGEPENEPPVLDAFISTGEAEVGEAVTYDATASSDPDGEIVSYLWDFGDGSTRTDAVGTYAYAAAGTYTVSVTITDDRGATAEGSTTIEIVDVANQPPVAVIAASVTEADINEAITFDGSQSADADGNIVAYQWNFGDGVEGINEVETYAYSAPGIYSVTLNVTDNDGATGQTAIQVNVFSTQQRLTVTPLTGKVEAGATVTLDVMYDTAGLPEDTYEGSITVSSGVGTVIVPVTVLVSRSVDIEKEGVPPVSEVRLAPNYPNPFAGTTQIRYELPADAQVSLNVFDVSGRRVRALEQGTKAPGLHEVSWDALDDGGNAVVSGLYFYRLTVLEQGGTQFSQTGTMTLVR